MGTGGLGIGPDGKPLKRTSAPAPGGGAVPKRGQNSRGGFKPGMRGGMHMMRGGMGPGPRGGPMGMGGPRGPMGMGGPRGPMGMGGPPTNTSFGFFNNVPPGAEHAGRPMALDKNGASGAAGYGGPSAGSVGQVPIGGVNTQKSLENKGQGDPGEVPGFGKNSSIHELFGKMVWRKMEGLKDQAVVDQLQNRIMNLIHEALSQQNEGNKSSASNSNPNPNVGVNNNGWQNPNSQQGFGASNYGFKSF